MAKTKTTELAVSKVRTDGGTQMRAALSQEKIDEYAADMKTGEMFEPIDVYHDGSSYWLADGFHRVYAAKQAKITKIAARVHSGTQRQALLHAVGANSRHGLPRTNADKRKAVESLLKDEQWGKWSDREIANRCGVSQPFVGKIRVELTDNGYQLPTSRTGADGKTRRAPEKTKKATAGKAAPRVVPEHVEEHDEPAFQVDADAPADDVGGEYRPEFYAGVAAAQAAGEPISTNPAKVEEPGEGLEDGILFDVLRGCEASANALKVAVSRWRSWVEAVTAYYKAHPEHEARLPIAEMNEIDRHLGARGATTIEHLAYRVSELAPEEVCGKCDGAGLDPEGVKCCRGRGWLSHGEAQERRRLAERAA